MTAGDEPITLTKKNILVVDDEPLNIFLLQQILKSYDFNLITATDGQEALESFTQTNFDLVLMDLYMPVMDGFEASKAIKKLCPTMPIIVISAAIVNVENLKKEIGIDYFIPKPIPIETLKNLVETLLLTK